MAYASAEDLITRYGESEIIQVSDRLGTGAADDAVVAAALVDADNEINGYIAVQYPLPLASVPPLVVLLACAIARYRLWSDDASEQIRQGYEDAIATLRRISSGAMLLSVPSGAAETPATGFAVVQSDRVFTDALMAGTLL